MKRFRANANFDFEPMGSPLGPRPCGKTRRLSFPAGSADPVRSREAFGARGFTPAVRRRFM